MALPDVDSTIRLTDVLLAILMIGGLPLIRMLRDMRDSIRDLKLMIGAPDQEDTIRGNIAYLKKKERDCAFFRAEAGAVLHIRSSGPPAEF